MSFSIWEMGQPLAMRWSVCASQVSGSTSFILAVCSRGAAKQRALITAIGVEFHQERIQAEHGRHHERAAVAILNVSSMNDGMNQQALRIDENVPLLALDLLSRVVARRINRSPPYMGRLK